MMSNKLLSASKFAPRKWFRHSARLADESRFDQRYDIPLASLQQGQDRWFDNTFRFLGWPLVEQSADTFAGDDNLMLMPSVDIHQGDKAYRISVEVPGVEKSDLKLEVDGHQLVVSGEKFQQSSDGDEGDKAHRVERRYGQFRRALSLPDDALVEDISAHFRNGVLAVTVPRDKSRAEVGRHIPIEKA